MPNKDDLSAKNDLLEQNKLTEDIKYRKSEVKLKDEDVKFRKSEVELKDLEIIEKTILVDELRDRNKEDKVYTELNKVRILSELLSNCTVDETSSTIGSETKWKASFDDKEQSKIKNKIFEIINKF